MTPKRNGRNAETLNDVRLLLQLQRTVWLRRAPLVR